MQMALLNSNFELFQTLIACETEADVINALKSAGYWDKPDAWRLYGDRENNFSIIGNQQARPVSALIEKFVNSVDAVLIRECHRKGINPESSDAPQSIEKALEGYFDIKNGNLANITASQRTKLASEIGFVATGSKRNPNYIFFDRGEGQSPHMMPKTFLSLAESNKLRIPFVQGKFNMGGSGVLRFCGDRHLQLVASKRDPIIKDQGDPSSDYWGFTIVRREDPADGRKNSTYTYLAPEEKVPTFDAPEIIIPENGRGTQKIDTLEWGSIIKLFDYEMPGGLKTNILFDLYNEVSLLLPKVGLPIRFYERRDYKGHSLETTMSGLHVRLEEDKRDNLEAGFPTFADFNAHKEMFHASVYAFQKGATEKYKKTQGILFTSHGQSHGTIPQSFFTRKKVGMSYLADSLLVIVDCDALQRRAREILFMNSRDRLSSGELRAEIERRLEEILNSHQGLRELRERRRRESIEEQLGESRPLKDVLNEILRNSPSLSALFITGSDIGNPFKSRLVGETKEFEGKPHPSYFKLKSGHAERDCHINMRFRVQFETDVDNEYFGRDRFPGTFRFHINGKPSTSYILNLWNGVATVTERLPRSAEVSDRIHGEVWVEDETLIEPLYCEFYRNVLPEKKPSGGGGKRQPPAGNGKGDRKIPEDLALPMIKEVREDEWDVHGFDKFSALKAIHTGDEGYDFFLNLDNVFLRTEMRSLKHDSEAQLLEARFKYAILLIGLCILKDQELFEAKTEEELGELDGKTIEEIVFEATRAIAPVVLPMIDTLGGLQIEDVTEQKQVDIEYES